MKVKVDELSTKVAGFDIAENLAEADSLLEDYTTATSKLVAVVTNASTQKIDFMITGNNKLLKQLITKLTTTASMATCTMTPIPAPLQDSNAPTNASTVGGASKVAGIRNVENLNQMQQNVSKVGYVWGQM